MADSNVTVTAGVGTSIDTRTEATNGHHRQVVVLGDPSTNAGVAPVDATAGLKVNLGADNDVTVTGTVDLGATDNAVLDAIESDTTAILSDTTTIASDTTSIDSKIPALGQALAAASVPVVLTAAQVSTLTPPAAITGYATSAKQDDIIAAIEAIPGGGGTQYTEGDTDATITGTAAMVEGAANALAVMTQPLTDTQLRAADVKITLDGESVPVTNAGITTIAGAVSGTEMQVDVLTMPTTTVTATDLDIRPLVNTDVVTAELSAVDNAVLDTIAAKDFATQTTLAAINTKLVSGTDIGDVTINNASGASAVNIQDGGNTITVDGTVGVSGTVAVTQSGTWDEVGINDSGNSITVDYATTGSGTATGALRVELPTNGTGTVGLNAGTNNIGDVDIASIAAGDNNIGNVDIVTVPTDPFGATADAAVTAGATGSISAKLRSISRDIVSNIVLAAGTNAIGKLAANSGVDIGDVDVTSISAGTNLVGDVGIQPRTTNGLDTFMASGSDGSSILVATAQAVKASAGKVYGYYLYNPESAVTFVHFYNTASGGVTVGTTSPLFTLQIPPASAANLMSEIGITFGTAITIAATTTAGGNTAPATGVSATIWFK